MTNKQDDFTLGGAKDQKIATEFKVNRLKYGLNYALSGSEVHLNLEICHRLPLIIFQNDILIRFLYFETFSWAEQKTSAYPLSKSTRLFYLYFTNTQIAYIFLLI